MKRGEWARQVAVWVHRRLRKKRGLMARANQQAGVGAHYFEQAAKKGTIDLHVLHHLEHLLGLRVHEMIRAAESEVRDEGGSQRIPMRDDSKAWRALEREIEAFELLCRRDAERAFEEAMRALEGETRASTRRARLLGCLAGAHRSQGLPGGLELIVEALALTTDPRALAELHSRRALAFLDRGDLTLSALAGQAALRHAHDDGLDAVGRAYLVEGVVAYHRDQAKKAELAWTLAIENLDARVPGGKRLKHAAHVNRGIVRTELSDIEGAKKDLDRSHACWMGPQDESAPLVARLASMERCWSEAAEAQRRVVERTQAPLTKAAESLTLVEWQLRAGDQEGAASTVAAMAGILETSEVNGYTEAVICGLIRAKYECRLDLPKVEAARRQLEEISRRAQRGHALGRSSLRRRR